MDADENNTDKLIAAALLYSPRSADHELARQVVPSEATKLQSRVEEIILDGIRFGARLIKHRPPSARSIWIMWDRYREDIVCEVLACLVADGKAQNEVQGGFSTRDEYERRIKKHAWNAYRRYRRRWRKERRQVSLDALDPSRTLQRCASSRFVQTTSDEILEHLRTRLSREDYSILLVRLDTPSSTQAAEKCGVPVKTVRTLICRVQTLLQDLNFGGEERSQSASVQTLPINLDFAAVN